MVGNQSAGSGSGTPPGDLLGFEDTGRVAELFGLLSDQARAGILYALLEAGELSTSDLSAWTGVPTRGAAEALRVLRTAHVVSSRRRAGTVTYALRGDHVRRLLQVAGTASASRRLWQLRGLDAGSRTA